jgi:hypothetical protein
MYALEDIVRMNETKPADKAPANLDNAIPAEDQVNYETAEAVAE